MTTQISIINRKLTKGDSHEVLETMLWLMESERFGVIRGKYYASSTMLSPNRFCYYNDLTDWDVGSL